MRARQSLWTAQQGWTGKSEGKADLFLAFGGTDCAELHNQTMTITVFGERTGA